MLAKLMEGRKYDCFLVDSVPSFRFLFFPLVGMRKLMCFLFETRGMSSLIESFLARKQTCKKKRSRFIHVSLSRVFRHRHSFTSSTSTSPTLLSSAHLDTNHIAQYGPSKTTHSYWWSEAEHADQKRTFPVFPSPAFTYHSLPFLSNPVFFNPSFDEKEE